MALIQRWAGSLSIAQRRNEIEVAILEAIKKQRIATQFVPYLEQRDNLGEIPRYVSSRAGSSAGESDTATITEMTLQTVNPTQVGFTVSLPSRMMGSSIIELPGTSRDIGNRLA